MIKRLLASLLALSLLLSVPIARADLEVNQLIGFGAKAEEIKLTYIGSVTSSVTTATENFGDFNIPNPGLVIVGTGVRAGVNVTVTSISIGGTNGTLQAAAQVTCVNAAVFGYRVITTPGNTNVTVTWSSTKNGGAVSVWLLTGYQSATENDSGNTTCASGTSAAVTVDIPQNGVVMFVASHANANATSWSSASERHDATFAGTSNFSSADRSVVTAIAGHVETASWTGSNGKQGAGISFQ